MAASTSRKISGNSRVCEERGLHLSICACPRTRERLLFIVSGPEKRGLHLSLRQIRLIRLMSPSIHARTVLDVHFLHHPLRQLVIDEVPLPTHGLLLRIRHSKHLCARQHRQYLYSVYLLYWYTSTNNDAADLVYSENACVQTA